MHCYSTLNFSRTLKTVGSDGSAGACLGSNGGARGGSLRDTVNLGATCEAPHVRVLCTSVVLSGLEHSESASVDGNGRIGSGKISFSSM